MNVSVRSVYKARFVSRSGVPELRDLIWSGKASMHECERVARLPIDDQKAVIDALNDGRIRRLRDAFVKPANLQFNKLCAAWKAASQQEKSDFLDFVIKGRAK